MSKRQGQIVEARMHVVLNQPLPTSREKFKQGVEHILRVAQQKAERDVPMSGQDIDLEPYFENIATLAEQWQRHELRVKAAALKTAGQAIPSIADI